MKRICVILLVIAGLSACGPKRVALGGYAGGFAPMTYSYGGVCTDGAVRTNFEFHSETDKLADGWHYFYRFKAVGKPMKVHILHLNDFGYISTLDFEIRSAPLFGEKQPRYMEVPTGDEGRSFKVVSRFSPDRTQAVFQLLDENLAQCYSETFSIDIPDEIP